jgi:hypothetical protein
MSLATTLKSVGSQVASFGANAIRDEAIKQIPRLIEENEPKVEASLVRILGTLKVQHPDEAQLFLQNWRKLNTVVEQQLGSAGGRRKRTRRHKRKARK